MKIFKNNSITVLTIVPMLNSFKYFSYNLALSEFTLFLLYVLYGRESLISM